MKKQTANTPASKAGKFISRFAFASLFLFSFSAANAQSTARQTETPLQIKYLGVVENQPLFQVDLDNESGEIYTLSIKADDGSVLYSERVKDKKFSKKIKWNNSETDNSKLVFILSGDKEKQTQVFEINTSLREVRDVVVTKL